MGKSNTARVARWTGTSRLPLSWSIPFSRKQQKTGTATSSNFIIKITRTYERNNKKKFEKFVIKNLS